MEMSRSDSPSVSADALSSYLSENLPVFISAEDVNKHPKLCHLLEDLSHVLTPTGTHKITQNQLDQATHAMKHARQKYLEEAVLHRLVEDVLCKSSTGEADPMLMQIGQVLTLQELQDHIQLCGEISSRTTSTINYSTGKNTTAATGSFGTESSGGGQRPRDGIQAHQEPLYIFGLNPDKLQARAELIITDKHLAKLSSILLKRLEQEWTKIGAFQNPTGFQGYNADDVAKVPDYCEDMKRKVKAEQKKLVHSTIQTDILFQQVYGLLLEYSHVLTALMSKQRLSHYPLEHVTSLTDILAAQILKTKSIELEILADTYTGDSIPALKAIRSQLEDRTAKMEASLAWLKNELMGYSGLDPSFQEMSKEYARLTQDINFLKLGRQK